MDDFSSTFRTTLLRLTRVKATNRTFEDDWVFAITVRNGKVTDIREYIDTLALARASEL